jgi:peptidyl-prolyl cis-trans isomerase A (cyclophilin A)
MTLLTTLLTIVIAAHSAPIPIRITTDFGVVEAELYPDKAPITVANFLKYVDAGHFNGGTFFRTVRPDNQPNDSVKIEVIQASVNPEHRRSGFGPIPIERTSVTGLHHEDGSLSMARSGPDTATSSFSICIGPQPALDFAGHRNLDGQGFAAFGKVTKGMDVVRKIQQQPAEGQNLTPRITILKIERI